jgi:hypothetical protein
MEEFNYIKLSIRSTKLLEIYIKFVFKIRVNFQEVWITFNKLNGLFNVYLKEWFKNTARLYRVKSTDTSNENKTRILIKSSK